MMLLSSIVVLLIFSSKVFATATSKMEDEYSESCSPYKSLNPYMFTARQRTQSSLLTADLEKDSTSKASGHTFLKACLKSETDKCTGHAYQYAYERYLTPLRKNKVLLLEIGLGCGQVNLGASVRMWLLFFPHLELHVMEYDKACGEKWYASQSAEVQSKVKIHFGDQSNSEDLLRVIKETGHNAFDVIIDDGGHGMAMQQVSIAQLFQFVKPGGVYVVEDLHTSYTMNDIHTKSPSTAQAFKMVLDWLLGDPRLDEKSNPYGVMKIMSDVEHMDCYPKMCAFQKYSANDMAYPYQVIAYGKDHA